MVGTGAIVSLIFCGILSVGIPIAAMIIAKKKLSGASWLSPLIGAGTFVVFALILEQICHAFMLPLVSGSTVAFVLYGAFAAGIFEETGRFLACRFLMKNRMDNANAVFMGIGHGGIEAVLVVGVSMLSTTITAFMVNAVGIEGLAAMSGISDAETLDMLRAQIDTVVAFSFPTAIAMVVERILAMTIHVCMSVFVMKAVSVKGKLWLYPAAILLHAGLDVFAALYQRGVITSLWVVEIILAVFAAVTVFLTTKVAKLENKAVTECE